MNASIGPGNAQSIAKKAFLDHIVGEYNWAPRNMWIRQQIIDSGFAEAHVKIEDLADPNQHTPLSRIDDPVSS